MSIQVIKIPRATDRAVIGAFVDLAKNYKILTINGNAIPFAPLGDLLVGEEPSGLWKQVLDQDSEVIDTLNIVVSGQHITYQRGGDSGPNKSPIWDELKFNNVQQCPIDVKIAAADFLVRKLRPFDPERTVTGRGFEAQEQSLAIHNATLERLEAVGATIAEQTLATRTNLERWYQDKDQARTAELEAERERLKTEHASRASELDRLSAEINQKVQAVDDRSNTHARREIRDKMLDEVKQRVSKFDVSQSTKKKRIPVEVAMLLFIMAIAAMLIYTMNESAALSARSEQAVSVLSVAINSNSGAPANDRALMLKDAISTLSQVAADKVPMYWLWARSAFLLIALACAFIYYIRWQDKWAERHATAELQLRQFEIDISRANWVLESCLEWKKEVKDVIPSTLLDRISHGVFVSGSEPAAVLHPADELASALLGSASKVKLRVGDSELDFDKPGKIPKSA